MSRRIALLCLTCCSLLGGISHAQIWTDITPEGGKHPTPRVNAAAIYDPVDHRMVVFGGRISGGEENDVWSLDLRSGQWSEMTPSGGSAPASRFTHNAVYDPQNHQMVIWAGQGHARVFFNDVWALDLSRNTWFEFMPSGPKPSVRYGTASTFDPLSRALVTFAGFTDQGRFDDTWRFSLEDSAWTEVSPSEGNPPRRCLHTASYDARNHRMIMYGGQQTGPLGDLWAFDLTQSTWTDLTPQEHPEGRFFATSICDARNHRVIVFGGDRGSDRKSDEVWAFDLTTNRWQEMRTSERPPQARDGATAIYIEPEDRMIVFGGRADVLLNDVWSLHPFSQNTPVEVGSTNTGRTPVRSVLYQNHPNPFNSTTVLSYDIAKPSHVALKVYDALGREVCTLVNERQTTGHRSVMWDGRSRFGQRVGSGVYLYRLETHESMTAKKLLLME